jgi:GNAT superfamily N-acetyltransferase
MPFIPANQSATQLAIVDYEPRHHEPFRRLNLEWISEYFEVEEPDRLALDDPEHHILDPGGCILIAEQAGEVVGTCALLRAPDGSFELAKMAVAKVVRGQGIGRALGQAAIARAKSCGARRMWLLSNTALGPAIRLYEKLGFQVVPLTSSEYRRANVKMERGL